TACSHSGLIEDAINIFNSMTEKYEILPEEKHYNCLIDVFGRAGRLDEAENIINNMNINPGEITLMTLLGACRTHIDVERAERVFDKIKKLESAQNIASAYVL